ncbi:GAF and ANTAR domain-containing protein [Arthrobacter agilis]|uniref:GAF and ANTAR domain-containing protein n=1 Tax=Arthrobacter agilis TaxID=37921 RepID=UPI0023656DF6|nr:GAF and ANTAR domain-containing protein [Arthrobacter agilis]WDF33209.1 GAF and ANTAR domain-containing protein [Arthrobacter agilis]
MSDRTGEGPQNDALIGETIGGLIEGRDVLAAQLGSLARSLQHEENPERILATMVRGAIDLIPGVAEGSISVVRDRKNVGSRAPSSELAERVDALQGQTGQGPCLDAMFMQKTVHVPDMASEKRWPQFASGAAAAGAGSMLCFQLWVEGDNLGALNLYAGHAGAFSRESVHVGLLVAAHAAVAFAEAMKVEQLGDALITRDLIGQAKGILIERYKITGDQAFTILDRSSSTTNQKLRDVAEHLVLTGEISR